MRTRRNSTIKDSIKVASWEVKKLIWNKAFIVSLLLTPIILGVFMGLPVLFERISEKEITNGGEWIDNGEAVGHLTTTRIYIIDEIGIYGQLSQKMVGVDNLVLEKHTGTKDNLRARVKDDANAGYVHITEEIFETRAVSIVTGGQDTHISFAFHDKLTQALMHFELAKHNVASEDVDRIIQATGGYVFNVVPITQAPPPPPDSMRGDVRELGFPGLTPDFTEFARRWAPPGFAMAIFFMILVSGMTTIQSTISDKRDKMVEILLSSVSASSLMYGKIIGNFLAGLIQMAVYGIYVVVFLHFFVLPRFDEIISVPQLLSYILSPELPLLLLFALSGYLLFSSLYAGMGATMEDLQSAGNFQGIVMFLPALPFIFMSHVIADPGGIIAQVGSYIPFTSSIIMILRITLLDLSWVEIIVPIVILLVSTVLIAKLAGKIFKTGMLMYGKGIDLREMWRWVRE